MKKTMIYLEDSQHERLRRLASERDSSLAGLIREAVDAYLATPTARSRPRFIGRGAGPIGGDTSSRVDEVLRELSR